MKSRKILALLLAVMLLVAIMPTSVVAEPAGDVGEVIINQTINDAKNMLTLEAYVTSDTVSSEEMISVPTDIILVLDQSKSMNDKYDKQGSRQEALKKAVCSFVDQVGEQYSETAKHKLAVVTFNNKTSTLVGWTEADTNGVEAVKAKVNGLGKCTGATYMADALDQAGNLISGRSETTYPLANGSELDRKVVVVVFTDGYPGTLNAIGDYFSNFYDTPKEADKAVAASAKLKEMGATVYTVGAFENANPAASYTTDKNSIIWTVWRSAAKSMNGFMHFLSSDYDASCTSWKEYTDNNDGRNNGYYFAADNSAALTRAFDEIASATVAKDDEISLDSTAVLKDVISEYFTVNGKVSVYTANYDSATGTFGEETAFNAKVEVDGKNVSVSGFDFAQHACRDGAKNGQKLIVKIPVKDVVNDFGNYAATENNSGIYDANGNIVAFAPLAKVSIANMIDLSSNSTSVPDVEKFFLDVFGDAAYFENLWPTMSSLRTIGNNIYLIDYQYDYDIDDLMEEGVSSAVDLLAYASTHILGGAFEFEMGQWGTGCSAYEAYNENGDHFMGRNFDYMDAPCYVVWTHPEDGYDSISMVDGTFMLTFDHLKPTSTMGRFQALLSPYLCLDGMNETGFAISVLQIHADGTKQDTGKTDMFTTAMIRCCLDKCATVDEAIELFKSFDVQDTIALGYSLGCCFHYMVTDANGDAAVIEYVNNEIRVTRAGDKGYDQLFVTNYYLAPDGGVGMDSYDPEGMERYDIIANTLTENNGVLSFDQAFDLLSDVHLNYRHDNNLYDITTLWSCLYNNNQQTMSLAARMDYSSIYTFSVTNPMRVYSIDSVDVKTPWEGIGLH